jgi:hypothetical protein
MRQRVSGYHQAIAARDLYREMTRCMSGGVKDTHTADELIAFLPPSPPYP